MGLTPLLAWKRLFIVVFSIDGHAGTHGVMDNQWRRLRTLMSIGIINVGSLYAKLIIISSSPGSYLLYG
jgi:hypothetical protein